VQAGTHGPSRGTQSHCVPGGSALPRASRARDPVAMEQGPYLVRHVRPGDAPGLLDFYAGLRPESRALRFMGATRGITQLQADVFARADGVHHDGFVAVERATNRIVGHLCLEPTSPNSEEIGVAVADDLQRRGIGRMLLRAAIVAARRRRTGILEATMLAGNTGIHRLLQTAGIPWRRRPLEPGIELIVLDLAAAAAA
jgi:GNAT superfamily N-acetyltransferase